MELFTDEGFTGIAGSMMTDETSEAAIRSLRDGLVGQDPMDYKHTWYEMYHSLVRERPQWGASVVAMSMVDVAVWDLIGKSLKTPVWRLLGGYREKVPCYASGGHYVTLGDHAEELRHLKSEMPRYLDMGFKAVKMRVGRNLEKDCERAEVVREAIGPEVELMMDFNTSRTYRGGASEAIRFMRALERFNPTWFEDPLAMDDIEGMAGVSSAIDTAVATGETGQTVWGFRDIIQRRAVDVILPDATVCGGITQWVEIAAFANAFRIPTAAHVAEEIHVHCVSSAPNGRTVEFFLPSDERRTAYMIAPPKVGKDGFLAVPQKPGLGVELNEDYIRTHLVA